MALQLRSMTKQDRLAFERLLAPPPKGHGFTKTYLAGLVGISKQALTRWEAVPMKYVVPLSKMTGIPKAELLPSVFS